MSDGISYITKKVYTDEVIDPSSAVLTPPKYREMRRMAYGGGSKTEIFLMQARFMQDFTDCLEYRGEFQCYYPTYEDMTTQQLRGYFTWRTHAREGNIGKTCTSFVFVYIYELINGIGVSSPDDANAKLFAVYNAFKDDETVRKYLEIWLEDFAAYHGLECKKEQGEQYHNAEVLNNYELYSPKDVFSAFNALSSYNIANSRIYSRYPEITLYAVYYMYCGMSQHYKKLGNESFFMRLFGSPYTAPYEMFAGALFLRGYHGDTVRDLGPFKRYECKNGQWQVTRIFTAKSGSKRAAELLRGIDALLRQSLGVTPFLKNALLNSLRAEVANKAIRAAVERVRAEKQREAVKSVKIDVGMLEGIRKDADDVAKMLTVPEDDVTLGMTEAQDNTISHMDNQTDVSRQAYNHASDLLSEEKEAQPAASATPSEEPELRDGGQDLLDKTEREYLYCVLRGEGGREALRKKGIMQSVVVESINEKLYDTFLDTVLDGDGNIIQDYLTELKGILGYDDT